MVENFYGNKKNQIVHDLSNEKPKCEIKQIKLIHKRYFMPDTFQQAVLENYTNCPYCIKDNDGLLGVVKDTTKEFEESNKARERIVSNITKKDIDDITKFKESKDRGINAVDVEVQQEEQKIRIKASKASRRSGNSEKESKIKKSKAKTKESRSSKKIATVRKRRQ